MIRLLEKQHSFHVAYYFKNFTVQHCVYTSENLRKSELEKNAAEFLMFGNSITSIS